jgi:hypothetical protein
MPTVLPLPAAPSITPHQAGAIASKARKFLRRGMLTHRQAVLLDCLLWSCRRPGQGAVAASLTVLSRLAHMSRETVVAGLRQLAKRGLLRIVKRRVRFAWLGGATASRQGVSAYVLMPPAAVPVTESAAATIKQELEFLVSPGPDALAAQTALAEVRERRMAALTSLWRSSRAVPV